MSLWRVLEIYGCNGNPVDGWEGCEQGDLGYLSIRDDWDDARIIKALADTGHLSKTAPEMFAAGELNMESDHGDGYEIGEIEQAWAHTEEIQREGEDAYLAAGYDPAMTAEEVAEAEDNGYTAAAYELVSAHRPFMRIEPEIPEDESEKVVFYREKAAFTTLKSLQKKYPHLQLQQSDARKNSAIIELRINPTKMSRQKNRRRNRGGGEDYSVLAVDVWVDGEFFGSRDFPDEFGEDDALGLAQNNGDIVFGSDELIAHAKVALDAFTERAGEPAPEFLRVPAKEDARFLFKNDPDLPSLVERDGVTNGRDNWPDSIDMGAADIRAIREVPSPAAGVAGARIWATAQVDSPDGVEAIDEYVKDIYKSSRPAGAGQYTKAQLDVLKLWYREGVISGLASFAREYNDEHGDELLVDAAEMENPSPLHPSAAELEAMPTLSQGQTADLKFDNGRTRIWLERVGVEDGARWDNGVVIEMLRRGRWETVEEYAG